MKRTARQGGYMFIEYFVLATIVFLAAIAFFNTTVPEGTAVNTQVQQAVKTQIDNIVNSGP